MFAVTTPNAGPPWSSILLGVAAAIVLLHAVRGWKSGVMRQLLSILALVLAYLAATVERDRMVPLLRPLGLPDRYLAFIGGVMLATVIYVVVMALSAIIFKKTSQQDVGLVRVGYGFFGALIGAVKGVVIVWLIFAVLRLIGVVAQVRVEMAKHPLPERVREQLPRGTEPKPPGPGVTALAQMKVAMDESPVGGLLDRLDPFPSSLHRIIPKTVRVLGDERAARRLQEFPGVTALLKHPKLLELQRDPEIGKAMAQQNYAAVFRNARFQEALGDEEFTGALRKFEFEKALDYALAPPEKTGAVPLER